MVAGGSGVTPFVSIMREFAGRCGTPGAPQQMTLLVSYRSKEDLILWNDLKALNKAEGCRVFTTLSRENLTTEGFLHGRIDAAMLKKIINGEQNNMTFMTCGPEHIMDLTVATCRESGVPEQHIKTESFF
jgi:ring-1,2-phenylacetyl-CoA epoxidase subunit PaaE